MIIKELDDFDPRDKFVQAGKAAEKQMAFYLRRAFQERTDIHIFNDLRLVNGDDAAQIDHLVLHRYGIIVVESKSVTTRVEINEHGEWKRWVDSTWQGMPSPVLQAKRQAEFLRKYLEAHAEQLLGKFLGLLQFHFGTMPTQWLVAISDAGIIARQAGISLPEVLKADQVPDRIQEMIAQRKKASSPLNFDLRDTGFHFSDAEFTRITEFLLQAHQPRPIKTRPLEAEASAQIVQKPGEKKGDRNGQVYPNLALKGKSSIQDQGTVAPTHCCSGCQSNDMIIAYKYNYFFKCLQCDKNIRIEVSCPTCQGKKKVRKSGLEFYVDCIPCRTAELFHINPETKQN